MKSNSFIKMDSNEMLLFCDLMQKEYNEKRNKPDKQININNVLNKVFNNEK